MAANGVGQLPGVVFKKSDRRLPERCRDARHRLRTRLRPRNAVGNRLEGPSHADSLCAYSLSAPVSSAVIPETGVADHSTCSTNS